MTAIPSVYTFKHIDVIDLSLSGATGVPFYRQIVDQVSALIRGGQLVSGDRLPSVRELAASLVVSLVTTRRAYADLQAAGLISRERGRGTFVARDVGRATKSQARTEATRMLREAVRCALQLGVDGAELDRLMRKVVREESDEE